MFYKTSKPLAETRRRLIRPMDFVQPMQMGFILSKRKAPPILERKHRYRSHRLALNRPKKNRDKKVAEDDWMEAEDDDRVEDEKDETRFSFVCRVTFVA